MLFEPLYRLKWWSREFKLNIRTGHLVLDVGSGNDPHPWADVLLDKALADNVERIGESLTFDDRPFVVADVENLPFHDLSFDYVICSHVLEHVEDAAKAIRGLMRVSKRGYIETPSEFGERLSGGGHASHRWLVSLENGVLRFKRKEKLIFDQVLYGVIPQLWKKNKSYMNFYWHSLDLFYVSYEWEGEIKFEVDWTGGAKSGTFKGAKDERVEEIRATLCHLVDSQEDNERMFDHLRSLMKLTMKQVRKARKSVDLYKILACPICQSEVKCVEDEVVCTNCSHRFPIIAGVPIMLIK